ncbi:High-affinity potassium uptake transporter [Entamoeba marina]
MHTYFTLAIILIVTLTSYFNELNHARLTLLEAFFLGTTTGTNTGLFNFDFTITKVSTQVIVIISSEVSGIFFASILVPSICRYFRLRQKLKDSNSSSHSPSKIISVDSSDTDFITEESYAMDLTSEFEPLHVDYHLELRSLKRFAFLLIFYTILFKLIGFCIFVYGVYSNNETLDYLKKQKLHPLWFCFFNTISSWNNLGLTINQDSLNPFISNEVICLNTVFLNMCGNVLIPIVSRGLVFIVHRLFEQRSSKNAKIQPWLYILKAPTRISISFFSSTQTKLLILVHLFLILLQVFFFVLFYTDTDYIRLYVGFVHSSFTRTAGFTITNIKELSPPILMTYILAMFISAYPIVVLRKFRDQQVNYNMGFERFPNNIKTIKNYVKNLFFTHIIWVYAFGLVLMALYSSTHSSPANELLDVMFEVTSAFGTIGMSLGSFRFPCSFSYELPPLGQIIICILMILGRHRGYPLNSYPPDYYN